MLGKTIYHDVSRNMKDISVISCLSAARESLLPDIVTPEDSPVVQEHLKRQGFRFGRDFALKVN
jgi:hypothetical protein